MDKYEFRGMIEFSKDHINNDNWVTLMLKHFDQLMSECIHWSVEDFEMQTQNIADDDWEEVYDKTKFQDTLELMIKKHDADTGINWETVTCYLNNYCKNDK